MELRLQAAWRTATECNKPATGRILPSSFGRCPEAERVAAKVLRKALKNQDVVGISESLEEGAEIKNTTRF